MNGTYYQSPEQHAQTPQPVGDRLQVTDIAGRFIETAIYNMPETSARRVAMSQTVAYEPETEVIESSANHVLTDRMAAFQPPAYPQQGSLSQEDMARDARNQIKEL